MAKKTNARARRRARAAELAAAQNWTREAALQALGPCPAVPRYCRVSEDSPNPRADAQYIAKQRDCRSSIARRKEWLRQRDEIEAEHRRRQKLLAAPKAEDSTTREDGLEVNAFDKDRGTPQRAAQGHGLHQAEIADPTPSNRSQKRTVTRATDTLGHLVRNRDIGRGHRKAGQRFQRDFAKAHLDRMAIATLVRVEGGGRRGGNGTVDGAKVDVGNAIRALGGERSQVASVIWYVLGQGYSIREWCLRMSMGHRRHVNPHVAKGLLIAGLETLHEFYFGDGVRGDGDGRKAA